MKTEIDGSVAIVTTAGAGATITVEDDSWGVGTIATLTGAPAGFSIGSETPGVNQTAGDYFTFYAGLSGSTVEYYCWFNATGGSAASEAPSTDPAASGTGIEIVHSFSANRATLAGLIETAITNESIANIVAVSDTTTCYIENTEWGLGSAMTEDIISANFSIAETQAGVATTVGSYVTFSAGIDTPVDYAAWFNATGGTSLGEGPSTVPTPGGGQTLIEVTHAFDDNLNEMATALKDALDIATLPDCAITGAGGASADVTIQNDEWGVGTISTVGTATTGFSITRDITGAAITDGNYFVFYSGIDTEEKNVAWFSATGGGAAVNTAPSTEPVVASTDNYIEINYAFDANAVTVGAALKNALDVASIDNITITVGGTADIVVVENTEYGVGTAATEDFAAGYTVSRTTTGVDDNSDPALGGGIAVQVNFAVNSANTAVGTAIKNAIDNLSSFGATLNTATVTITNGIIGDEINTGAGDSGFAVATSIEGDVDDATTKDPKIPYTTSVEVALGTLDDNDTIADKIATALDALANFGATDASNVVTVVNDSNGECTLGVNESTNLEFETSVQGSLGQVPGSSSGDFIKIVGKIAGPAVIDGYPVIGNFNSITIIVPKEDIVIIESDN